MEKYKRRERIKNEKILFIYYMKEIKIRRL